MKMKGTLIFDFLRNSRARRRRRIKEFKAEIAQALETPSPFQTVKIGPLPMSPIILKPNIQPLDRQLKEGLSYIV